LFSEGWHRLTLLAREAGKELEVRRRDLDAGDVAPPLQVLGRDPEGKAEPREKTYHVALPHGLEELVRKGWETLWGYHV